MKLIKSDHGFKAWISANESWEWANRPNERWPCSQLSGNRLFVEFDQGGLIDLSINGNSDSDVDATELTALVSDLVGKRLPQDHPCQVYLR